MVNTCAFIEEARQESVDTILALAERQRDGAELVVTGCLAERYGDELAEALPEVDAVAGFGVPVTLGRRVGRQPAGARASTCSTSPGRRRGAVGVRQGGRGLRQGLRLLRHPSVPGPAAQPRRSTSILAEVEALGRGVREIVLVAQDLAAYGRDQGRGERRDRARWSRRSPRRVDRVRLLYLYPSDLTDALDRRHLRHRRAVLRPLAAARVAARCCAGCAGGATASGSSRRIDGIRAAEPDAAFRSNFIVGYPGETEDDHDALLAFVARGPARLVRVLRLLARSRAPTPPGSTARSTGGLVARAPGRAARAAGRDHRGPT